MASRLESRHFSETAREFNQGSLLRLGFNSLFGYLCMQREKRVLRAKAETFHSHKLIDRSLRALLLYMCHRRFKREKETEALQTIGDMQDYSS